MPLLPNGGFETGDFTGWNADPQWSVTAGASHSGSYGAQCEITSSGYIELYTPITLTSSGTLSFYISAPSISVPVGEEYSISIMVYLFSQSWDLISTLYDTVYTSESEPIDWTYIECELPLYVGEGILYIGISSYGGGGGEV